MCDVANGTGNYLSQNKRLTFLTMTTFLYTTGIELPNVMEFTVVSMSGREGRGGTLQAHLNCGASVMVPDFISEGQRIKVNTADDTYVERA